MNGPFGDLEKEKRSKPKRFERENFS